MELNVILDSVGDEILVSAGLDLTAILPLKIALRPERGEAKIVDAILGTTDRNGLLANQYVTYTIEAGVIDKIGRWQHQLNYGLQKLNWVNFNVT